MKVFVSYTRNKNAKNAVSRFIEYFQMELRNFARESAVFMDTNDIDPGDHFKAEITQALDDADVLLVLVSPAWLESPMCRDEFNLFSAKKTAQGQPRYILPVLWVDTPALKNPGQDRIAEELEAMQYEDWRKLRHRVSPRRIAELAERAVAHLSKQERVEAERR